MSSPGLRRPLTTEAAELQTKHHEKPDSHGIPMCTGLYAVQHVRRMRGGSQAHLLRASDGAFYVTKFQNNPQHIRVLANEMLATRLGLALGLPMPPVAVIEVCDWLIEHTPDLRISLGGAKIPC